MAILMRDKRGRPRKLCKETLHFHKFQVIQNYWTTPNSFSIIESFHYDWPPFVVVHFNCIDWPRKPRGALFVCDRFVFRTLVSVSTLRCKHSSSFSLLGCQSLRFSNWCVVRSSATGMTVCQFSFDYWWDATGFPIRAWHIEEETIVSSTWHLSGSNWELSCTSTRVVLFVSVGWCSFVGSDDCSYSCMHLFSFWNVCGLSDILLVFDLASEKNIGSPISYHNYHIEPNWMDKKVMIDRFDYHLSSIFCI